MEGGGPTWVGVVQGGDKPSIASTSGCARDIVNEIEACS
jgi:hypothetical protein